MSSMLPCGFAFIPHASAEDTVSVVKAGEQLGFESAWLPDQTFYSDPFVLLAACAVATQRLVLGLGVTNPYTRHPALTARAAATVDELSKGRFILTYGAGNLPELLTPLGIPRTEAAQRCREAVMVTKQLLAGEEVHHRSATLVADGVRLLAPARPNLPVYLAARSPGTLRVAGEVADGVILGGLFADAAYQGALRQIEVGAKATGRSLRGIAIVIWATAYLTDFPPTDIDTFKREAARVIGRAAASTLKTGGWSQSRIESLHTAHAAGGPTAMAGLLTDDELESISLFGDSARARKTLERLEASGVSRFVLLLREAPAKRHIELLAHFAANVISRS